MQHHDGITATSKHNIELGMMGKMNNSVAQITTQFKAMQSLP